MEVVTDDSGLDSTSKSKCQLCLKDVSRYTCPRCNIPYCSVNCYKGIAHAQCSEGFYRDCFMDGLKHMNNPEDKTKVMEMLKRISNQDDSAIPQGAAPDLTQGAAPELDSDDEEEEGEDLSERMKNLDLDMDTDQIWSCLTEQERSEFQDMMQDGRLGELVTPWKPWWLQEQAQPPLVSEIVNDVDNMQQDVASSDVCSTVPAVLPDIPQLSMLLKNKVPSDTVSYTLINIIYGYAYINRLYNGECREYPDQCAQELLRLCPALGVTTYSSVPQAIQGCIECLTNQAKSLFVSHEYSVGAVEDVRKIIHGTGPGDQLSYAEAVVSDIHGLYTDTVASLSQACKRKSNDRDRNGSEHVLPPGDLKKHRHRCFTVTKKLEFLLSWLQQYGQQLAKMETLVQIEFCEMSSRLNAHKKTDKNLRQLKNNAARKPGPTGTLIQEVSPSGV